MSLSFQPIWFDSMGAKSSCTAVQTADIKIVLEPGIAIMHDSFPGSDKEKNQWLQQGINAIKQAGEQADLLICSHYHFDHYINDDFEYYRDKILLIKNPNEYINDKQFNRAKDFFSKLNQYYPNTEDVSAPSSQQEKSFPDPFQALPLAANRDYGDYNSRKQELMQKGRIWFQNRLKNWVHHDFIPEKTQSNEISVKYPEGKTYRFGDTCIRCTQALFHGIEFSRVGWVFSTIIEHNKKKFIHTSDLCGPMIEDYAEFIIQENPDILILDGPMTYMYGYLLTRINLQRCIENAERIIRETDIELMIYDHHLTRDKNYKKHTQDVWNTARDYGTTLLTAAEYLGKTPVVLNM